MLKEFRDFIMRGNVIDLAVAVVIGGAFAALIGAFTEAFITPVINSFFYLVGLSQEGTGWVVTLPGSQELKIGMMLTALIVFLLTALVVFFVFVKPINHLKDRLLPTEEVQEEDEPSAEELLAEIRDLLKAQGDK